MVKNYYVVLGIGSDATEDEIKSAYRREAKRCHPDRSGEDSEPFLAVREAYEVLADPRRRRTYDRELVNEQSRAQDVPTAVGAEPLRRRRPPVEPLVPGPRSARRDTGRYAFSASPISSLIDELLGARRSGAAPQEIHFEVSLTQSQALRGGRLRVWVPAQVRCPACRGSGGSAFFVCQHCLGRGIVTDDVPLDINLPGGLADGDRGSLPLGRPGMPGLLLVLHFRVDDQV